MPFAYAFHITMNYHRDQSVQIYQAARNIDDLIRANELVSTDVLKVT